MGTGKSLDQWIEDSDAEQLRLDVACNIDNYFPIGEVTVCAAGDIRDCTRLIMMAVRQWYEERCSPQTRGKL